MASNLIQIKRSLTTATPGSLANGELAYTANGDALFIGSNGGVVAIGGKRVPGVLTANQALVANATSGIDKVIVANLVPTSVWANGAAGTSGQVLASNSTGGVYWSTPAAAVAGSDTQIQFNDGGNLAGDAGLTYNKTTDTVTVTGSVLAGPAVNAASHTIGSTFIANTTGVYHTGVVNAASLTVGTSFIANTTRVVIGTAVGLQANGGIGTAGQVLTSNATTVYWSTPTTGTVTSVASGNGLTGGPITSTGTLSVVAGSGIASNSTGVHVVAGTNSGLVSNSTGVFIAATDGLIANATGLHVGAGNGITVATDSVSVTAGAGIASNSTGVHVVAGASGGLVSNSTGVFVSAGSGLLSNSTGLHVGAANGISVAADAVGLTTGSTLTVNSTGAHVNTTLSLTTLTTSGDVQIGGNLTVLGDLLTINVATLAVEDSLIQLAANNTASDLVDIGFFGSYEAGDAGAHEHTGLFRDASDSGIYKLFMNLEEAPTTTVNTSGVGYTTGTLEAYLRSGGLVSNSTAVTLTANSTLAVNLTANSLTLTTPLAATSGGTGFNTYTSGDIIVANTGNALSKLSLGTNGYVLQSNGTALVYDTLDGGTF